MLEYSVVLHVTDTDYTVVKRNFCGFEWEIEVKDDKDHANIILSCNRGVEGISWQCTAVVTVHVPGISKVVSTFHSKQRSTVVTVPRTELGNPIKITIELQDISGCRDVAMFEHDFTRPSELTNACIAFENSDTRVYVIREYLLFNSRRFATLLKRMVPPREHTPVSTLNRSECSEFDVLSSQTTLNDPALCTEDAEDANIAPPQDDDVTTLPSTVCQENGIYLLRGVCAGDFIILLKAIHPPFAEVTDKNVESLLATAFRLGVEHIVWKCEAFLRTEGARRLFDVFSRLVFAITYKLSALENDCLSALHNVNDIRTMLMDSRMESAPQELRILLLEILFQRLSSETCPASLKVDTMSEASQTCFSPSAASSGSENVCSGSETGEVQGKGKMSISEQEKTTEDLDKKTVSSACTTSTQLVQHRKQISKKRISVARTRLARKQKPRCKPEYVNRRRVAGDPACRPEYSDFPGLLICEAINVCKFSKEPEPIWCTVYPYEEDRSMTFESSPHTMFVDLVLPPTNSLKSVVCSFASHFYTKVFKEWDDMPTGVYYYTELSHEMLPSVPKMILDSIIAGCEFDVQVGSDDLLFDKLKDYIGKQLDSYEHYQR